MLFHIARNSLMVNNMLQFHKCVHVKKHDIVYGLCLGHQQVFDIIERYVYDILVIERRTRKNKHGATVYWRSK